MRDVVFSCDDAGAKFLRVTVYSLLKSYAGEEPIRVNVFEGYGGHSAASKEALRAVVEKFPNASLRYLDVEAAIKPYEETILHRANSRWNVFTWAPIFVPQLLADATGNVLHLDIDMLVVQDVSPLFELDLKENLIAAVAEYDVGPIPPHVARYFNTGTILFNVEKCRAERTWEKLVAWYRDHYEIAERIEQDAWNALYHDRTLLLPLKWNFHDRLVKTYPSRDVNADLWMGNPPKECLDAALHPAILHFWGPKKPWKTCHRPYRKLYHDALRALGEEVPKEPVLAFYYDWVNRFNLARIARQANRLQTSHARRARRRAIRHALLAPFEWAGIALGFLLFSFLPRRALLCVADAISAIYYWFDRLGRSNARENLAVMYGDRISPARARLIVRRSYRNMCRTVMHAFWTCIRAKARAASAGELSPRCVEFLKANRPAITVSAHLGCWEILSQLAYLNGHEMMSVAKNIGSKGMTRLLMKTRRSIGQEIVPAQGAFKPLMTGLKAGKSLGLLVDQSVSQRKGGIWITFMGRPVTASPAPAFFSAKAKVPIIVAWSRPLKDGRYRCEFVRSYEPSEARDIRGLTELIASDLASVIRRHPSAWILNYNYFNRHGKAHIPDWGQSPKKCEI